MEQYKDNKPENLQEMQRPAQPPSKFSKIVVIVVMVAIGLAVLRHWRSGQIEQAGLAEPYTWYWETSQ